MIGVNPNCFARRATSLGQLLEVIKGVALTVWRTRHAKQRSAQWSNGKVICEFVKTGFRVILRLNPIAPIPLTPHDDRVGKHGED